MLRVALAIFLVLGTAQAVRADDTETLRAQARGPPLGSLLSPFIIPAAVLGEGALCLWLLAMGVNLRNWEEQSSPGSPYGGVSGAIAS